MSAMPPRTRRREFDPWPGYVDVLSTLLMVVIFVLMVFVIAQVFLTQALTRSKDALDELRHPDRGSVGHAGEAGPGPGATAATTSPSGRSALADNHGQATTSAGAAADRLVSERQGRADAPRENNEKRRAWPFGCEAKKSGIPTPPSGARRRRRRRREGPRPSGRRWPRNSKTPTRRSMPTRRRSSHAGGARRAAEGARRSGQAGRRTAGRAPPEGRGTGRRPKRS